MSLHTIEDLTSCILDFQANMVRVMHRKKTTLVDPDNEPTHAEVLHYIWDSGGLEVAEDETGFIIQWRNLGFESEDIIAEFSEVGVLGLDCLVASNFASSLHRPYRHLMSNGRKVSLKTTQIFPRSGMLLVALTLNLTCAVLPFSLS